jgi:formylglycine-generating enzyme required for sulfatase activity
MQLDRPGFRLPTESEWEIACRGGVRSAYGFGGDGALLGKYAWYEDNSDRKTHSPRQLRPNLRGLFDMHGNQWEWTYDWYTPYSNKTEINPLGVEGGDSRAFRGGSWGVKAPFCRSAVRSGIAPVTSGPNDGFRLALSLSGFSNRVEQDDEINKRDVNSH